MKTRTMLLFTSLMFSNNTFPATPIVIYNNATCKNNSQYWTLERLKSARPLPLPIIESSSPKTHSITERIDSEGVPQQVDEKKVPYSVAGKLYFTKSNGNDSYCSAQFVGSSSLLLTAGHCVRDSKTGEWRNNFYFVQADRDGSGSDTFDWKYVVTWSDLYAPEKGKINWGRDYAFVRTSKDNHRGYLGWQIRIPFNNFSEIGYPTTFHNGRYMMKISGHKGNTLSNPHVVQMINNPMRKGNSGGAWIGNLGDNNSENNHVIGVESFSYTNDDNSTYSPYLDDDFTYLIRFSRGLSMNNEN